MVLSLNRHHLFKHSTQVMGIKQVITKDKMSRCLDKFSLLVPYETYGEQ